MGITDKETVIHKLEVLKFLIEWELPLDYFVAIEKAVELLKEGGHNENIEM